MVKRISEKLSIDKARLYALITEFVSNLPDDVLEHEDDAISKFPKLKEDRYSYIYSTYNLSKEDFLSAFHESEQTYQYLMISYKKGGKSLKLMYEDEHLSQREKNALENILYREYVILDGHRILCSRSEISEYALRTYAKEGITFEEFLQLYQMVLEGFGLQDNPKLEMMDRSYENKLLNSNHILWKQHKKMRYYNINAYYFRELLSKIGLKNYQNIEISTLKLFREFPELMCDYDILDEYELHNLLKKFVRKKNFLLLSLKGCRILNSERRAGKRK